MIPALLLALREAVEAALVIGVVLGALQKAERTEWNRVVWLGAGTAVLMSAAVALGLNALRLSLVGPWEPVFEGLMMFLAAGILTWMIIWMFRQGRNEGGRLAAGAMDAVLRGGGAALFLLAFTAVLREGIELAIFLLAAVPGADGAQVALGAGLGIMLAALAGAVVFAFALRLDARRFFLVTGIFLILFAAGLTGRGVHEMNEVGVIPAVVNHVWDSNTVVAQDSAVGGILQALFGYNAEPSLTEVIAYAGYFIAAALMFIFVGRSAPKGKLQPPSGMPSV